MSVVGPDEVETPIGYVELDRARANARRVAHYAAEHGLRWRPHIKTHKSTAVARIQLEEGAQGVTVATLREAEVMATLTSDILLAYPPVGAAKLSRLLDLPAEVQLIVSLDAVDVLEPLATACADAGRSVDILVEQDMGLGRTGVQTADEVVALAHRAAELDGASFRGLLFYPGHIRIGTGEQGGPIAEVADRLRDTLDALEAAGLPPDIVSGGSTPTLWRSHEMKGLTEIRAGSCIFYDREALEVGTARPEDVAYTVLATVVSIAVPGHAVVDAGSKALAKESRGGDAGFGVLLRHPEIVLCSLSEEHGVLDLSASDWRPRIGERVRIIPNHVCVSVNLQETLLARRDDHHELLSPECRGRGPWTG